MNLIRVLMLGDLVGEPGRALFKKHIGRIKKEYSIDAVILNGENSAHGRGITPGLVQFFRANGADVITSGNHIWDCKDIYSYFDGHTDLLRPANFPGETPGKGVTTFLCKGLEIGVINVQGRVFMREHLSCPFRAIESILTFLRHKTKIILVDVHAETTAEKMALALYFDGKVSALVGTHTHVQTADERVLPGGTAFITDLGMGGSLNSMIGMKKEPIITHFLTQMPVRFSVDTEPPFVMSGAYIDIDTETGRAVDIKRIRVIDNEPLVD